MKTTLPESISTKEEAIAFLTALHKNDEAYHPDDSAETIITRSGKRLFTNKEAKKLNALMDQVFALTCWTADFDPYTILMDLQTRDQFINKNLAEDVIKDVFSRDLEYFYSIEKNPHTGSKDLRLTDTVNVWVYQYQTRKSINTDIAELQNMDYKMTEEI